MRKSITQTGLFILMALFPFLSTAQNAAIYMDNTDQTIRGFGGMNFPRWIADLTPAQIDRAFGNGNGQIGLSILRVSVAPESSQWSLELPAAQRAKSHGAIVFATPWSPPASMKTNNSVVRGELRPNAYGAYAQYLTDFTNYMASNGASLHAISIQNEPDWLPEYESCGWSPQQMRTFLDNNASIIPTRVIAPETVHYKDSYMSALASSSQVDILATHAYGGNPTRFWSDKELWMTEHYAPNSNPNSANNWPEALEAGKEIHDYMINGYNAYVWWYIRRSYGLLTEDGNVSKRGFVMSHFSKFVRPGYVRVRAESTPTGGVSVSSYKNGNTLVIVAINQNSSSRSMNFDFSGYNVTNITKWETTGSVGHNVAQVGTFSGGTSLTNNLAGHSITTFRGTIGNGGSANAVYRLQNRGTGLFLDGLGRTANGDPCGQYANTSHVNAQWERISVGNGYFQLRNVGTGLFLDGMGLTTSGSDVGMWANTTHQNSHWNIGQFDGNYYRIQNRSTGLYLDGMGRTSNSAACGQWANTSHVNAQWQLVPVSGSALATEQQSSLRIQKNTEDNSEITSMVVYPNPASERLQISLRGHTGLVEATIYDVTGQLIKRYVLDGTDNSIDVDQLSSGVYFVELASSSGVKRSRFVKE